MIKNISIEMILDNVTMIHKLQGVINMNNFIQWFDSLTQIAVIGVAIYFFSQGRIDLAIFFMLFAILLKQRIIK